MNWVAICRACKVDPEIEIAKLVSRSFRSCHSAAICLGLAKIETNLAEAKPVKNEITDLIKRIRKAVSHISP
ncbi:MAG TPA: hypothetical protein VK797_03245 [Tepidisphaeraceae bacterium]|nr:hypothetical protein [Tepidisphaeraceae bacterium]